MSLLQNAMEDCQMLDKTRIDDGYGGYITKYVPGVTFQAAIVLDDSMEAQTAQAAGVTAIYTVTTPKQMTLEFHEVFKRMSDGKIFRVTNDGHDKKTPNTATLNMRQVRAESWVIPDNE
jgi:hypothetical protein